MIGSRLGPYEIVAKLGEGGMGEVWRAKDLQLGRDVALKVLPEGFTADPDRLARFAREAKLLAQLNHPHIAQIHGFEVSGETRALVMELVEGPTLAERLAAGPLPLTESLSVSLQIAQALEEAHEKGIVHRDLKPQNIKASIEGKVKVLDFGLAKAMDPAPGSSSAAEFANSPTVTFGGTREGVILGTAAYMSPEQARGAPVDKRADIWAFGVVLYEMLTGERLFAERSVVDTLSAVMRKEIDFARLPSSTPPAIVRLLRRCLERNPKNRLRDIGDARLVLEETLAGEPEEAGPLATALVGRTSRVTVAMAALAAGIALLFVVSLALRREAPAPIPETSVVRFPLVSDPSLFVYTDLTTPFAVSSDGKTVVFVAASGGEPIQLFLRTLDDPRPRRIEGTEGATQPAISPDGEWVAFLVRSSQIRKVRLKGGTPIDVATIANVSASLTWASGDELLFELIGEDAGIHRVSATGGAPRELIPIDRAAGETRQRRPFVLRKERIVLYASSTADGRVTLASYALADGRRARLEVEGVQALGMVDGRLVYARADGNLMAVPLDLGTLRVTGAAVELSERVESSSFGTRVALSEAGTLVFRAGSASTTSRLVLVDAQGSSRPLGAQRGSFNSLRFSPDGRRIAVGIGEAIGAAGGSAVQDLWLIDRDSGEATRLTRTGNASMPEWSPDGSGLVYIARQPSKRNEIWTLPLDGSAEASRLIEVDGDPIHAVLAPDGRSVVVVLDLPDSPNHELVRVALDGSAKATVLAGPSVQGSVRRPILPRISPDGGSVAFVDRSIWEIFVRRMDGAGTLQVTDDGGWCPAWGPDSRHLFFGNGNVLSVAELRVAPSLAVAGRRTVATLAHLAEEFDLSPDGKTFVVVAPTAEGTDVLVAVHWSDELPRTWRQSARGEGAR